MTDRIDIIWGLQTSDRPEPTLGHACQGDFQTGLQQEPRLFTFPQKRISVGPRPLACIDICRRKEIPGKSKIHLRSVLPRELMEGMPDPVSTKRSRPSRTWSVTVRRNLPLERSYCIKLYFASPQYDVFKPHAAPQKTRVGDFENVVRFQCIGVPDTIKF